MATNQNDQNLNGRKPDCGNLGLWLLPVCVHSGLWTFRLVAILVSAFSGCGHFDTLPL